MLGTNFTSRRQIESSMFHKQIHDKQFLIVQSFLSRALSHSFSLSFSTSASRAGGLSTANFIDTVCKAVQSELTTSASIGGGGSFPSLFFPAYGCASASLPANWLVASVSSPWRFSHACRTGALVSSSSCVLPLATCSSNLRPALGPPFPPTLPPPGRC